MAYKPSNVNGVPVPYDAPVSGLIATLSEEPGCWAAYVALGHKSDHEAFEALVKAIRSTDWRHRRAAAEALGYHPEGPRAAGSLIELLGDRSQYVVRAACSALAEMSAGEGHDPIVGLLDAKDSDTREVALRALGALWRDTDFRRVLDLHLKDVSRSARREAAWTLRDNAGEGIWRTLFDAWHDDELHRHRVWACQLAEQFGDSDLRPALAALAEDRDGHVRKAARRALEAIE